MDYVTIDNTDIQEFNIEKSIIDNKSIVGSCHLGKAEIKLLNDSNEYSIFKDNWINTPRGSFYIYDVEPVQEKVSIKLSCYDITCKLDVPYKETDFTSLFPCSILTWRNAMASKLGITFGDDQNFPNANYILDKHPYVGENVSYRQVYSQILQACASFMTTDELDRFYFSWVDSTTIYNIEDWGSLTTEKQLTPPVNVVVLGRGDVEDIVTWPNTEPQEPHEFRIDNNYILDPQDTDTQTDRRYEVIQPIYNRVKDFSYMIFSMEAVPNSNAFNIKPGKKISYLDIWGNELIAVVMSVSLKYLGGSLTDPLNWAIEMSAEKLNETASEYNYSKGIYNYLTETSIKVDKNAKKIILLNQELGEQEQRVSSIEVDVDDIKAQINDQIDTTTSAESSIASLLLEKVNEGPPINLIIEPISSNISRLYPFKQTPVEEKIIYCGKYYFEEIFYPMVGSTDEERTANLARMASTGININIENLALISTSDETYNNNISYLESHTSVENTKVYIYPTEPYSKTSYTIRCDIAEEENKSNVLLGDPNLYEKYRIVRFTNLDTNEIFDYELPKDLLKYSPEIKDKFEFDYQNQICRVIKKCAYDDYGRIIILEEPIIYNFDIPDVRLTSGNYRISLPGYSDGYIFVRLMQQNIYTKEMATKIDLNAKFELTNQNIIAEVKRETTRATGVEETIDGKVEVAAGAISAEVTRATEAEENIRGIVELKLGPDDTNQIVSMLNAVVNLLTITSDNFILDKFGNVTANNIHLRGGEISLNDDGTSENAAIKIKRISTNYRCIESGNDYSGLKLKVDPPRTYREFLSQWAGNRTLLVTEDGKKITTVQEIVGTVSHTIGWKYKVVASWTEEVLYQLFYNQEEDTTSITQNTPITLPSNFNVLGIASGSTMFEWLKIQESTENTTSYAGNGVTSDIVTDNELTHADYVKLQKYINGTGTLTNSEKIKYDFNGDGTINVLDLLMCSKLVFSNISKTRPGKFVINTEAEDGNLLIQDGDGNVRVSLGLKGCDFNSPPYVSYDFPLRINGQPAVSTGDQGTTIRDVSIVEDTNPYLKITDSSGNEYSVSMTRL